LTFDGVDVYTKGKILKKEEVEVFVSSSHRKKAPTSEVFPCAECGEPQMVRVVETCRLADGLQVKNLAHYKCGSCGSRFFDDDAMNHIAAARASHRSSASTC